MGLVSQPVSRRRRIPEQYLAADGGGPTRRGPAAPRDRGELPATFRSAPNEWYRWENDLRANPDIDILLSIDPGSFPLGTGPKPGEIWHEGYYPVVWTNRRYHMIYLNMGHNDIDYEHQTYRDLSSTFASEIQDRLIIQGLLWLGRRGPAN